MWKYYIAGWLGSFVGGILSLFWWLVNMHSVDSHLISIILFFYLGGLLAGYVGNRLDMKFTKGTPASYQSPPSVGG